MFLLKFSYCFICILNTNRNHYVSINSDNLLKFNMRKFNVPFLLIYFNIIFSFYSQNKKIHYLNVCKLSLKDQCEIITFYFLFNYSKIKLNSHVYVKRVCLVYGVGRGQSRYLSPRMYILQSRVNKNQKIYAELMVGKTSAY